MPKAAIMTLADDVRKKITDFIEDADSVKGDLWDEMLELGKSEKLNPDLRGAVAEIVSDLDKEAINEAKGKLKSFLASCDEKAEEPHPPKEDPKAVVDEPVEKGKIQFHLNFKELDPDDEKREIEGFASVTGVIDRDGEIMDPKAFNAGLGEFMKQNPILLLNHDREKAIGHILAAEVKKKGLWVKAKLASGTESSDEAWSLIKQKVLRSFSVGGMFERVRNRIMSWDLTEISIVSVPANQRATFSIAKGFTDGTDLVDSPIGGYVEQLEKKKELFYLEENTSFIDDAITKLKDLQCSEDAGADLKAKEVFESCVKEVEDVMPKEVKEIADLVREELAAEAKTEGEAKAAQELHDKEVREAAVKDYKGSLAKSGVEFPMDDDEAGEGEKGSAIVVHGRYDGMDLEELVFADQFMQAAGISPSRDLRGALGEKALAHFKTSAGRKDFDPGQKQNELMSTDPLSATPSTGEEWVPTLEAAILWPKIQLASKVAGLFKSIAMPSNPYDYPLSISGPTIYTVAEASAAGDIEADAAKFTKSVVTTGKRTFNALKMGALSYFSEELIEDSIIPVLPQLRLDFVDAMTRGLDRALISGDENGATSSTNISYDGASEVTGAWYRVTDGLRHEALVTTVTDNYDAGVLTYDDIRQVQKLMGTAGKLGTNVADLVLICDPGVGLVLSDLDEVITVDKMGPKATVHNGMLGAIKGIPIINVEEYDLTDSAGKIASSAGNNTLGSFLIVNRKGVMLGYRRRLTMTIDRVPYSDLRYLVASMRFDIQYREAGVVGLGYNITV